MLTRGRTGKDPVLLLTGLIKVEYLLHLGDFTRGAKAVHHAFAYSNESIFFAVYTSIVVYVYTIHSHFFVKIYFTNPFVFTNYILGTHTLLTNFLQVTNKPNHVRTPIIPMYKIQ